MITTTCWILWIPCSAGVPAASAGLLPKAGAAVRAISDEVARPSKRGRMVTIDMNTLQPVSCGGLRSRAAATGPRARGEARSVRLVQYPDRSEGGDPGRRIRLATQRGDGRTPQADGGDRRQA